MKQETDVVFGVTGGCVVNLVDSFYKEGLRIIPMHHEQSAAIAADAYARFKGFGVCYGTSGPGTTNLITGTGCSYYDSVPVLTLGGQVPRKFLTGKDRQMGFQQTDGVSLFRPITKYSKRMTSMFDLEEAISYAKRPRKGPTFLEIPDDFQRDVIDDDVQRVSDIIMGWGGTPFSEIIQLEESVKSAKRPLAVIGAGAKDATLRIEIPFLYTWGAKDRFYNHPNCVGDFGVTGSPEGNRMLTESDLILMIGTRMDSHQVPNWETFAPQARKIAMGLEFPHKADKVIDCVLDFPINLHGKNWGYHSRNTTDTPIYRWVDEICWKSEEGDIIIPDMGQTGCIVWQRWAPKKNQRLFNGLNHSPMGYSLPASIGASLANPGRRVLSIIGDGSLMMNLQDLQTIHDLKLPVEIYVVNNGGYGMIRQTHNDWKDNLEQGVACNFGIPNISKLRDTFGVDIREVKFDDTTISPKWKYGEELFKGGRTCPDFYLL